MEQEQFCLVCFTSFKKPEGKVYETVEGADLFRTFILFTQQYLSVSGGSVQQLGRREVEEKAKVAGVFCGSCEVVVSSICKLYKKLCEVQMQLAWKLGQLGELIGNVAETSSSLIIEDRLGAQLEIVGDEPGNERRRILKDFRSAVAVNCVRHFRNGQKLDMIVNRQNHGETAENNCDSDGISLGVSCEIEANVANGDDSHGTVDSQYFNGNIVVGTHFLCTQPSIETGIPQPVVERTEAKKVECHNCHKTFAHKYSLEKHLRTMHGIETTFSCSDCNIRFLSRHELQQHRNEVHYGRKVNNNTIKTFQKKKNGRFQKCTECGLQFSSKALLMDHMNVHAQRGRKTKKRNANTKNAYVPMVPPNWKECGDCGERFPPNVFYYHVKKVHGHGSRHACPEPGCGKEFLFPTGLQRHMLHHGEKRFDCRVCQKKFSQLQTLKKHLESQHGQTLEFSHGNTPNQRPKSQVAVNAQVISTTDEVTRTPTLNMNNSNININVRRNSGGLIATENFQQVYHHPHHVPHPQQHQLQAQQISNSGASWLFIPTWSNNESGQGGSGSGVGHR